MFSVILSVGRFDAYGLLNFKGISGYPSNMKYRSSTNRCLPVSTEMFPAKETSVREAAVLSLFLLLDKDTLLQVPVY